jgi:predicted helicase
MNAVDYTPFEGICFTDTFQLNKSTSDTMIDSINRDRLRQHAKTPITVIIGNPPYSINGANDPQLKKVKYDDLDKNIKKKYIDTSDSRNTKSLYDSYIRAFRYATDRIDNNNGVIGFVSNGGWLTSSSNRGLRKSFEEEFSKIYIYDLRGDKRATGEKSKKEGRNVFGDGSRTAVTITILVKKKNFKGQAEIFYSDIGDYLKTREKLEKIKNSQSFLSDKFQHICKLKLVNPGNWLINENKLFDEFTPIANDRTSTYDKFSKSVFTTSTLGISTNRDVWAYSYSKDTLIQKISNMIEYYNEELEKPQRDNPRRIAWTIGLKRLKNKSKKIIFDSKLIRKASYRPFCSKLLYFSSEIVERLAFFNSLSPNEDFDNLYICISKDTKNELSALITPFITDLHYLDNTRCLPLYYYDMNNEQDKNDLLSNISKDKNIKHDGISDYFTKLVEFKYNKRIAKEDIFYYVYGILHSIDFKTQFSDNLKLSLPRIPVVDSIIDFIEFSKAGKKLANLHINYEGVQHLKCVRVLGDLKNSYVNKMSFIDKKRKDTIIYNAHIRIENIPDLAYEYIVKGKSAIEHIIEHYQLKTDKKSGMTTNPNECNGGVKDYVLNLLLSVIAVSVKTMEIVNNLPKLNFKDPQNLEEK